MYIYPRYSFVRIVMLSNFPEANLYRATHLLSQFCLPFDNHPEYCHCNMTKYIIYIAFSYLRPVSERWRSFSEFAHRELSAHACQTADAHIVNSHHSIRDYSKKSTQIRESRAP